MIDDDVFYDLNDQYAIGALAAWTCSPQSSAFELPTNPTGQLAQVLATGVLQVGGIGPSNWGPDGNYQVSPPVGYWPDYMSAIVQRLGAAYNRTVTVQRTFFSSSTAALQAVLAGTVHVTEPYFVVPGFLSGAPRISALVASCTTAGYSSSFFVNTTSSISSLAQLQAALAAGGGSTVAVGSLSEGDFHSVQPVLPPGTRNVVMNGLTALADAVSSGQVLAALVSGNPPAGFVSFSSTIVSPRALFLSPSTASCEPPADSALQASPVIAALAVAAVIGGAWVRL